MADTKLTREWVEEELISAEKYGLHRQAALCRHYLATEQDALGPIERNDDYEREYIPLQTLERMAREIHAACLATEQNARAPDHVIAEWLDRHDLRMALPGQDARCAFEDAESWRAALTQKEPPK